MLQSARAPFCGGRDSIDPFYDSKVGWRERAKLHLRKMHYARNTMQRIGFQWRGIRGIVGCVLF